MIDISRNVKGVAQTETSSEHTRGGFLLPIHQFISLLQIKGGRKFG